MADPDFHIRGGGGGGGGEVGSGHPDPKNKAGRTPKKFFRPFGPQFALKIRGGGRTPAPPFDSATRVISMILSSNC